MLKPNYFPLGVNDDNSVYPISIVVAFVHRRRRPSSSRTPSYLGGPDPFWNYGQRYTASNMGRNARTYAPTRLLLSLFESQHYVVVAIARDRGCVPTRLPTSSVSVVRPGRTISKRKLDFADPYRNLGDGIYERTERHHHAAVAAIDALHSELHPPASIFVDRIGSVCSSFGGCGRR